MLRRHWVFSSLLISPVLQILRPWFRLTATELCYRTEPVATARDVDDWSDIDPSLCTERWLLLASEAYSWDHTWHRRPTNSWQLIGHWCILIEYLQVHEQWRIIRGTHEALEPALLRMEPQKIRTLETLLVLIWLDTLPLAASFKLRFK